MDYNLVYINFEIFLMSQILYLLYLVYNFYSWNGVIECVV